MPANHASDPHADPADRRAAARAARTTGGPKAPRWASWAVPLLIAVLALVPYWSARSFELVWDDPFLLQQLEAKDHAGGVAGLLGAEFRLLPDRATGYYRPLTTATLVLDARPAWGDANPDQVRRAAARLHRTNLGLHAACSALVAVLFQQLLGLGWPAALGAALFAVHPTHIEPAVFVSARADSLACLFSLLSVLAWLAARGETDRAGRRRWLLGGAGVAALLAALAKESALLLPVAIAAWSALLRRDGRGPHRRVPQVRWGELAPWLVAVAVALLLRLVVAHVGFGTRVDASSSGGLGAFLRLGVPALLLYLRLWVIPWPLNAYYTGSQLAITAWTGIAVVALAAVTWVAVRRGRRALALAGWAFAVVFLIPVLHLAPLQGAAAAERFLYLPSVGLCLLAATALAGLEATTNAGNTRVVAGVILLAYVATSAAGVKPWQSNQTLFTRMVATSPTAPVAHHGLASVYAEQGLQLKAIEHYRRALELKPDHMGALNGLAVANIQMKKYEEARPPLQQALRLRPDLPDAYTNMGISYAMQDSYQVAIPYFVQAAKLNPRSPRARFNLGLALQQVGDHDGARAELEVLTKLDRAMAERLRNEIEGKAPPQPTPP